MQADTTETSREAFATVRASGRRNEVQERIVAFLLNWRGPLTRQDLAHYLNEPINVICPRVKELLGDGRLEVTSSTRVDRNGQKCTRRELLMLPSEQYPLFAKPERTEAIQEARA